MIDKLRALWTTRSARGFARRQQWTAARHERLAQALQLSSSPRRTPQPAWNASMRSCRKTVQASAAAGVCGTTVSSWETGISGIRQQQRSLAVPNAPHRQLCFRQKAEPSRADRSVDDSDITRPTTIPTAIGKEITGLPSRVGVLVTTWRGRALSAARESILLVYSGLIDNSLVVVLEWLKVDRLLRLLQPKLESFCATVFGSYHEMPDGTRIPLSLVNNTAPYFDLCPQYSLPEVFLPGTKGAGYDDRIAHFMALCMKIVYEEPEVIHDVIERLWGLTCHGYYQTEAVTEVLYDVENDNTADFIPRTRACMMSSRDAIMIAFRGSEPLNLINLRSSGKITMRPRFDCGRIHDGFHAALFHLDPEKAESLFTKLVVELQSSSLPQDGPIYLAGHSLGGALAGVFAAALATKHPELSARIEGIYTFGMPRVGDVEFCRRMDEVYPDKCHRITHAADVIPLVPPRFLEYSHFGEEHYLTSLGRAVQGNDAILRARRIETLAFPFLYLWKLLAGLLLNPREGSLRTVYRLAMLVSFPGLTDHFPADYAYRLEGCIGKESDRPEQTW